MTVYIPCRYHYESQLRLRLAEMSLDKYLWFFTLHIEVHRNRTIRFGVRKFTEQYPPLYISDSNDCGLMEGKRIGELHNTSRSENRDAKILNGRTCHIFAILTTVFKGPQYMKRLKGTIKYYNKIDFTTGYPIRSFNCYGNVPLQRKSCLCNSDTRVS